MRRCLFLALVFFYGCSSTPQQPVYGPSTTAVEPASRLNRDQANDVTLYAISLVGTPYRRGGNTPEAGFDCSGLIAHVYKHNAAIVSPRTVATLAGWGQPVTIEAVRTGDLVVFGPAKAATHAGIYVGEGRFVHAPSTGGTVRLDPLNSSYWRKQEVQFRRP
jgi:cell wall-associated NlpC family hydrolase